MGRAERGLYLEEFEIGREFTSPTRVITEADINTFATLSGDHNALHTDEEYARSTPFGQRIAHGLLGLSIASGLACQGGFIDSTVLAFTGLQWKFKAPVFIGDTITMQATVAKNRPLRATGGGLVVLDIDVTNQDGQVVQTGSWSLLIKSRDQNQA